MTISEGTIYKIDLEDKGQDFTTFYVENGVIIHVEPFQGWVWRGKQFTQTSFAAGDPLIFKDGPRLNYHVAAVKAIRPIFSYEFWLKKVDHLARGPAGVDNFTDTTGAKKRGDPWIQMYLAEMTPAQALDMELAAEAV